MALPLQSLLGIPVLLVLAWLFSENRRAIPWRSVGAGLLLQLILALVLLKLPGSRNFFLLLNNAVQALEQATREGTSFVFGYLGGGEIPFKTKQGADTYILAFQGLPLILVISALSSLLFYWGILQRIVRGFSFVLRRTLGVGGAEGVGTAANVFLGMVEAPLFVKPYLPRMHRGEIFCLMSSGMATIAGTVMVLYASILSPVMQNAMGHLLTASLLSAPAAVAVARILIPAPADRLTGAEVHSPVRASGSMDAVASGTQEGASLLIQIIALLIVLIALVSLINQILGILPSVGGDPLTLQRILGWIMAPVVWLLGIPWEECFAAGGLMGTKTVLNEFLAYLELAELPQESLSERSRLIMTYAMCGFANPGSLGIMLGGLGGLAPERKAEIAGMGLKSILAGTLATCLTGSIVGVLFW
ncbi:MAG: nucleoside:proton symporter [Desulfohalobiaceae bacterium]|nr:nucleoside:proton symporter [Desulfohalobiaceae bacterium]